VTCAKDEYGCPVLDLWHCALNREIDPAKVTPVLVELVLKGRKEPPRRYPRVAGSLSWSSTSIRDFSLAGPAQQLLIKAGDLSPEQIEEFQEKWSVPLEIPSQVLSAAENVPGVGIEKDTRPRVLIIDSEEHGQKIKDIIEATCAEAIVDHCVIGDDPAELVLAIQTWPGATEGAQRPCNVICICATLPDIPEGLELAILDALEDRAIIVAPSVHRRVLDVPARLPGVIPIVPTQAKSTMLDTALATAAGMLAQRHVDRGDIAAFPSEMAVCGQVFRVGHKGA
jgi:hypothetical protein